MFDSSTHILHVSANATTALAYFWLTYQLLSFAVNAKLMKTTYHLSQTKDRKKRNLFLMLVSCISLFAAFISLCGTTHLISPFRFFCPSVTALKTAQLVMLVLCAGVSLSTAIVAYMMIPHILISLNKFELTSEGRLQHAENYLIEVVEMIQESIMVLGESCEVVRCNEATRLLLGTSQCLNRNYKEFIHPHDLEAFSHAISRVMGSYSSTPVTVEYRVNQATVVLDKIRPTNKCRKNPAGNKIYAAEEETAADEMSPPPQTEVMSAQSQLLDAPANSYVWVESTICKGMTIKYGDHFEYDIKLVSRNIEDRKNAAQQRHLHDVAQENEERARFNAAKLRYISCIAHDLKTPLQSFCFSLDLLDQTPLMAEQREYVQQANVAVDLMKLTISQTMDISKALKGVKLMPRRATVDLASIIHRVQIIINGYGKQVPVLFDVSPDLADRIITDEEWLWQMVLNLLTNACKYTDKGEIKVVLSRKQSSAFAAEEMLLIEVVDTGVGVDDAKIGSIFEAFAQVQSGQVTGTGLGLYGVRTRAEGLLGTCGARHNTESSTGTGTVLWFAIPYIPDRSEDTNVVGTRGAGVLGHNAPAQSLELGHVPLCGPICHESPHITKKVGGKESEDPVMVFIRSRKISAMVIDDTSTVRKLMERLLMKMGFESVVCYENGAKGLDAMMAAPVDIVFSDVQMPIMTGPEMVRRFRKFEAEELKTGAREMRQLVVAVTANGSELSESGNTGFDEVCPKPLSVRDIENLVKKYFM